MMPMGDRFDERSGWPSIDDPQVEALLAGREVPADLAPLAAVVGALKEAAVQPAPPAPSLALQISAGTFGGAEAAPPPTPTGDRRLPDGWWVPAPPGWTVEVTEVQPRLAARTASVGVVIVLLGVGTAGFHGALPEPAQVRFERVVETVTPYEFPERTVGGIGSGVQRSVSDDDGDPGGHGESGDRTAGEAHGAAGPAVEPGRAGPVTDGVTGDGVGDDNGVGHEGAAGGDFAGGAGDSVGGGVPGGGNVPGSENAPGNVGPPGGDDAAGGGGVVGRGDRDPAARGPVVEVPAAGGHAAAPDVAGRAGLPAGPPAPGQEAATGNGQAVGDETPPGP
jgi:hypothetical protein